MHTNKEFFTGLLIGLLILIGFSLVIAFSSSNEQPNVSNPTKNEGQNVNSEYRDVMESKNYNPNSEGGESCYGQICN